MSHGYHKDEVRAVIDRAVDEAMESIKKGSNTSAAAVQEENITAAVSVGIGVDASAAAAAAAANGTIPPYCLNVRRLTAPPRL
ncbi:hypothetical protein [Pseudalkalibacillus sp. SCS-8]|uniref:hypothetical protein n=1 Tax=Pseudalkalibacillus nanhaiensis TaxID=3115291 RepID=UPI0032DA59EF